MGQLPFYRPDSQQTARFTTPPFTRIEIPLFGNRSTGEAFPQYEGEFAYVESCDLPCEVSFVTADRSQTVAMPDGTTVSGPFKGIVLKHDNYLDDFGAKLVLVIAKSAKFENALFSPIVRQPIAYNRSVSAGLGGSVSYKFPVQAKSRYIRQLDLMIDATFAAALAQTCKVVVFFLSDPLGTGIQPSQISKQGVTYASRPTYQTQDVMTQSTIVAATFKYRLYAHFNNIPIPAMAQICSVGIIFEAATNLVSVDSTANSDLQAVLS